MSGLMMKNTIDNFFKYSFHVCFKRFYRGTTGATGKVRTRPQQPGFALHPQVGILLTEKPRRYRL